MALFTVAYISKPFTAHSELKSSMYILHANQLLSAAFELGRRWKCCTCRGFGICVLHETLHVETTPVGEMDYWKANLRNNAFLEISNGPPVQDG